MMNKTVKWILIGLGVALVAFLIAMPILNMVVGGSRLGMNDWRFDRFGSRTTLMPMLWWMGSWRMFFPRGILALLVVGIVLLVGGKSSASHPVQPPPTSGTVEEPRVCRNCGKPLHSEGEYCPYCGEQQ